MQKAIATAMTEGRWNDFTPDLLRGAPWASSMAESTMMMLETAVMRKQKTMLPAVSMRAFPDGNRQGSTVLTARAQTIRVMLDIGSKIASAMVVKRDKEPEEMAP